MAPRRGLLYLVAGFALALLAGRGLAALYGDWAFHHALGSDALWRSRLLTTLALRAAVGATVFAFVFAHLFAVRQSIVSLVLPRQVGNLEFGEAIPTRRLTFLAFGGAAVIAAVLTLVDLEWTVARLAVGGIPFGELDPYLERDLGFYAYWLPFERALQRIAAAAVLLTAVLVLGLYALTPSIRWTAEGLYVSTWVRRHLGVLGAITIALVGWDWRLDRFALLTEGSAATAWVEAPRHFSAFDHRVLLPYLAVMAFLAIPAAAVFTWTVWRGYLRLAFGLLTALLVAGPVTRLLLPLSVRDDPRTAAARERPYLATRALYARRAFGVDQIARPETLSLGTLPREALARRVSSWDPAALVRSVEFERRGTDVAALAWEGTPDGLVATLLREAPPGAPPGTRWPLDRLRAGGAEVTGTPLVAGGGGAGAIGGILVAPGAGRYVLVGDTAGRIAAPRFGSGLERWGHAWDQQNPRLLAAEPPAPRPRIVTHRDVRERLARVAPFFAAGPTITPLVHGDSLTWVVELFAVAEAYPLAERLVFAGATAHYVRHAATALVQAQTGVVTLLPVAAPDPVTRSWMALYPTLFTPRANAPSGLREALPPALDWAAVQGTVLGRTGFLADTIPVRALARVDDADADLAEGPAAFFQLGDGGRLAWSVPITDHADRLTGLLVARGGLMPRTEFHPLAGTVRWMQVLERLQAAADSIGVGRGRTAVRRGRVQAIPLTSGGVLFTQSFYDWPADGPPRLLATLVLDGERVRSGATLGAALGLEAGGATIGAMPAEAFRARAAALYDAMAAALRAGDWRAYGDAWAALGRLLGRPDR